MYIYQGQKGWSVKWLLTKKNRQIILQSQSSGFQYLSKVRWFFHWLFVFLHSVSEYKKRYIRNSTQILENLRNAVVGFFGLRNKGVDHSGARLTSSGAFLGSQRVKYFLMGFFQPFQKALICFVFDRFWIRAVLFELG